jgi:hypothetical protein
MDGVREVFHSLVGFLRFVGVMLACVVLGMAAVLAFLLVIDLYPKIPQEFGGALPQPACLDVVKAQVSSETIAGIFAVNENRPDDTVVRSREVEVLFSGSDVMIIRSQGRVYRITKDAIQTVTTCN